MPERPAPSADFVRRCLAVLADRGFSRVVTGALSPHEQAGFLAAGFTVAEQLHLLAHDLADLPDLPDAARQLRRARHRDRPAVLTVDGAAFPPFWRLDPRGLSDALSATPRVRFRVAPSAEHGPDRLRGYAICGRAGDRGFVQRLAVDPAAQRMGLGWALMVDGLHWLSRRGVRRAVVNTQQGNASALTLYERLGFRHEPVGLSVLSAGLSS